MSEMIYTEEQIEEIKERVFSALETVIDPELGIDIVNLGLIYEVLFDENGSCQVNMTLTTMGCPLADVIHNEVDRAMRSVPEVKDVNIKLVWYPSWTTERMSRYARIALGIR